MPLLLHGRLRAENRPITPQAIRALLNIAVDQSGLTNAVGWPARPPTSGTARCTGARHRLHDLRAPTPPRSPAHRHG